jgi:hypothetical protein
MLSEENLPNGALMRKVAGNKMRDVVMNPLRATVEQKLEMVNRRNHRTLAIVPDLCFRGRKWILNHSWWLRKESGRGSKLTLSA